jgi:membrane protein
MIASVPRRSRASRLVDIGHVVRQSLVSWFKDGAPSMGAAIAFYTLFAIAPILLIVIWVAGEFIGPDIVQSQILAQMRDLLGDTGTAAVRALLISAKYSTQSAYSTAIGLIALLIGATSVFAELQNALNRIWHTPPRDAVQSLWNLIRARVLSFGLILGVGFLLLVSLIVSAGLAGLGNWLGTIIAEWPRVLFMLNMLFGFATATVLFALIYKYVPNADIAWGDVWVGGLVTASLFAAGKLVIVVYFGRIAVASVYGIAGSFLVLLLWVYYSAQVFLLGAEFTSHYAGRHGAKDAPSP